MGEPVIGEILNTEGSLKTEILEAMDKEFINFFEPTYSAPKAPNADVVIPVQSVAAPDNPELDPEYEVIIPKKPTAKPVVEKTLTEVPVEPVVSPTIDQPSVSFTPQPKSEPVAPTSEPVISPAPESVVEPTPEPEPVDPNYQEPSCDVIIGKNSDSPQFGILGKMNSNGRVIGLDLNECNTISLFGVQGAGKSYTIGQSQKCYFVNSLR